MIIGLEKTVTPPGDKGREDSPSTYILLNARQWSGILHGIVAKHTVLPSHIFTGELLHDLQLLWPDLLHENHSADNINILEEYVASMYGVFQNVSIPPLQYTLSHSSKPPSSYLPLSDLHISAIQTPLLPQA
jgi:hypothetical protein